MKNLLDLLKKYEKKHAPRVFESGIIRFPHWYKLSLYTDGSGLIEDTCGKSIDNPQVLFRFENIDQLKKELLK